MVQVLNSSNISTTIDARGPRFSALITAGVLGVALASNNLWIILFQAVIFAVGAYKGPQFTPYAFLFKKLIKPRLKGAAIPEDVRPPQFAQSVGFLFAIVAIAGAIAGVDLIFTAAVAMALGAAFLNAAFNYCLGCEIYLLLLRARSK